MDGTFNDSDRLISLAAIELTGHKRRLFVAEVTLTLCDGNPRRSEERFGWSRVTVFTRPASSPAAAAPWFGPVN